MQVHERTLQGDFLLALLRQAMAITTRQPNSKLQSDD